MPYRTLENLPPDKKEVVIRACLEEITVSGYENSSTNRIVKKLGISKGSLFQYFGSKDGLYYYLVKTAARGLLREAEREVSRLPVELLERMKRVLEMVLDLYIRYPGYFRLFRTLSEHKARPMREKIVLEYSPALFRLTTSVFRGVRTDRLRFGLERTLEFLKWVLNGWLAELNGDALTEASGDLLRKKYAGKIANLIELLKSGVYDCRDGEAA